MSKEEELKLEDTAWGKHRKKAQALEMPSSIMVYAESGVGKTTLAASSSAVKELSPALLVDVEGSAGGVGRLYPDLDVVKAPTWNHITTIVEDLKKGNGLGYKTVIFDTFNSIQRKARQHFESLSKNVSNKFGVWSDLDDAMRDMLDSLHQEHPEFLKFWIAHPEVEKDEHTGRIMYNIEMQGRATKKHVPTVPDILGYYQFETTDQGTSRVLLVDKSPQHVTKNRFGLPEKIVNPTMQDIMNLIKEAQKEQK